MGPFGPRSLLSHRFSPPTVFFLGGPKFLPPGWGAPNPPPPGRGLYPPPGPPGRGPPNPPPGPLGRGPPKPLLLGAPGRGPKPPPAGRSSRGRASLTDKLRPMKGCWLNRSTACSATVRSRNSTKANPLGRPVSRSTGITTCEGSPTAEKCDRRSASVAPYGMLPTNKRTATDYPRL